MFFFTFAFLSLTAVQAAKNCYPTTPIVPPPRNLSTSPIFKQATQNLTKTYDNITSGYYAVPWPVQNVSFSVAVVALDQHDPHVPVWEYHHLAEGNGKGTKVLDRESQWLIGSITKAVTDYLMLKSGIDIHKSVVEYLPQLRDAELKSTTRWEDVTLGMLGSHMAGVTADYGFSEYYYLKDVFEAYGLPPLGESEYPPCGVIGLNGGCSAQEYLQGISGAHPITAPNERPAYSNAAFNIIGLALEAYTGKNYTELVRDYVCADLGMGSTYPSPGDDDRGVIPPGESSWGADYGLNAPAGGLVSTISDLSRFSHGLLTDSLALTPAQTRAWLKPQDFAEGPYTSVGMPWEISRLPGLVNPENPSRTVTIYGKSGGAQSYRSQLSVVPEYGVAIVVLTAGSMRALPSIFDAAVASVLPAVDAAARGRAKQDYARTFASSECQGSSNSAQQDESAGRSDVRVVIEQDSDSLVLASLTSTDGENRTSEVVEAIRGIWNMTIGEYTGSAIGTTVRLFPTALSGEETLPGMKTPARSEVWRLWPDLEASVPVGGPELPGAGLVSGRECMTWSIGDWVHYGREPLDRIVFYRDEEDEVVGVEVPFLRSGFLSPE